MFSMLFKSRCFTLFKCVFTVAVFASTGWRLAVILGLGAYHHQAVDSDAPALNDFSFLSDPSSIPELPIFFMNANGEQERQRRMEKMFEELGIQRHVAVRVPTFEVSEFQAMLDKGQVKLQPNIAIIGRPGVPQVVKQGPFRLPGKDKEFTEVADQRSKNTTLVAGNASIAGPDGLPQYDYSQQRYSFKEGARLLSHLEAIRQAYQADHRYALILEDDASLTPGFVKYWKTFAKLAPDDWNILQWHTDFDIVYNQGLELTDDPWISWKHEHKSARANMYSRKGMRRILELTYSLDERMQSQWTLEPSSNTEETLHYYGKQTYTSTKPWIDSLDRSNENNLVAFDPNAPGIYPQLSKLKELKRVPNLKRGKRLESILVLTQYRLNTMEEARVELDWLNSDATELCSLHDVCEWHVSVIVTDQAVFRNEDFTALQADLPPNVFLYVKVENRAVNKYSFITSFVDEMPHYDLVLLKDYDHRITGFPWTTFVAKKGSAIVASPLHQISESERFGGLHRAKASMQVPFHDGHSWQGTSSNNWARTLYENVTPMNTPYLDSYFVLLDAQFAKWFFSMIRIPEFTQQGSEWGPDLMLCGAAQAWKKARPSCHLVPLVMKHEDGKIDPPQLLGQFMTLSRNELEYVFRRRKFRLTQWVAEASYWKDIITETDLETLKQICTQPPFDVDPFSIQKCINQIPRAMAAGKLLLVVALFVLLGVCVLPLAWCYRTGKGFRTGAQSLLEFGVQNRIISRAQQHSVLASLGGYLAYFDSLFTTRSSRLRNRRRTKGSGV